MEPNKEISEIDQQIKILREQKERLMEAEREKERLASRKLTINITKLNTVTQKFKIQLSKPIWPIVDFIRYKAVGRFTEGTNNDIHVVPISFHDTFIEYLTSDKSKEQYDIDIIYEKGFREELEKYKNRPDLYVDVDKSWITLTLGPNLDRNSFYLGGEISTIVHDSKGMRFSVTEFPFFPDLVKKVAVLKRVEYSPEAEKLLLTSLDRRKLIADLATATDTDLPNPFVDPFNLKAHQRVAVKFTEVSGGRAIIAYDMGTGKTAIACGLAERNLSYKRVVVLCPAALKTNWKRDIKKFTGHDANVLQGIEPDSLSIDTLMDNKYKYHIINYDIIGRKIGGVKGSDKPEDQGVMKWVELFNILGVDFWILDEAHYIKNTSSNRSQGAMALKYKDVIPMTGTPIVNRPGELFPLLHIVAPDVFNSAGTFNSQFIDPEGNPRNVQKLHKLLTPFMIRRTRKDIYGDKIHIERIPFTKELSAKARPLYNKILEGIYISLRKPDYRTNVTSILAELIRCKQCCSADNVETTAELAEDALQETDKKVIIFSQFKESQGEINKILGSRAAIINGDVKDDKRYELVDAFQKKDSDLKFIITNIMEGLTLTEAHTVIFNDLWWTPKDHNQAEGRAFGRDNDPHGGNAYYLENENTIDQFINGLLLKKMDIFNQIVEGVRGSAENEGSIVDELMNHLRGGF